jgi:alkanesulfonate monooxygenase SsuD/methylene tetrahydromethanopterin reductase-like flavin-dependent oxidoreductase (luciferase family)
VNDTPQGDALASLQVAAAVTSRLRLATGVISVDRRAPETIVDAVRNRDLPIDRLVLGIGASAPPHPLSRISDAIRVIKSGLNVPVVIGALGPRMRRLGVQEADGLLLNWLTPDGARAAMADKDRDLATSGESAEVGLYIRVALGADAGARLRAEADRYGAIPSYKANFARLGFSALETAVEADSSEDIRAGLAAFTNTVDEPVVRAITATDSLAEYVALLDAITEEGQDREWRPRR